MMWGLSIQFIWRRVWPVMECCSHGNERLQFIK